MGNSERHSNSTAVDTGNEDKWLLEITSQKLRLWAIIAAVVVFAIHISVSYTHLTLPTTR